MHAARAIHKQREKREEKLRLEVRRPSASSQTSRIIPRSPAVSIDASRRNNTEDGERFNFAYAGFIIACFGAVPLLVGTFVEVPALWEIGLVITLVGILIGLVFWCTELCAEAKKFSQKKKQLSTRGKIEDSNLLQVPDRKSNRHNGLTSDSRRGSLQSDSISLISPTAQHYENQQRNAGNHVHLHNPQHDRVRGEDSISQYSLSEASKQSNDSSSGTLKPSKLNGHQIRPPSSSYLPPGLNKSKKVSLVQQDPGLDDDSDSDAETVIEAPTGNPKIIQVQSEHHHHPITRPLLFKGDSLSSVTDRTGNPVSVIDLGSSKPFLATSFSLENETISPLVPHHRTVLRMPVMPQEVSKLKRCECGRFLMDTDKLISLRGHHPYMTGGSVPPTAYNSPAWSIGWNPSRKIFGSVGGAVGVVGNSIAGGALNDLSNNSSLNDVSSGGNDNLPDNTKIISVNPSSTSNSNISNDGNQVSGYNNDRALAALATTVSTTSHLPANESVVQVEPTLSASTAELLRSHQNLSTIKTENNTENDNLAPNPDEIEDVNEEENDEDKDKVLAELLNITAEADDDNEKSEPMRDLASASLSSINSVKAAPSETKDKVNLEIEERVPVRQRHFSEQPGLEATRVNRPTSLHLQSNSAIDLNNAPTLNSSSSTVITPASSSSASTVVSTGVTAITPFLKDEDDMDDLKEDDIDNDDEQKSSAESVKSLAKDMSLDELLDTIEQKTEGGSSTGSSNSAIAVAVQ
ncbi:unnamed protein product [Orchesella dallaii]|uniref:Uncharacterized protein n=1 Tax=Orchesella dallaii TaxID=48710 RepID=A0ABP1S6B0_9HEXA